MYLQLPQTGSLSRSPAASTDMGCTFACPVYRILRPQDCLCRQQSTAFSKMTDTCSSHPSRPKGSRLARMLARMVARLLTLARMYSSTYWNGGVATVGSKPVHDALCGIAVFEAKGLPQCTWFPFLREGDDLFRFVPSDEMKDASFQLCLRWFVLLSRIGLGVRYLPGTNVQRHIVARMYSKFYGTIYGTNAVLLARFYRKYLRNGFDDLVR